MLYNDGITAYALSFFCHHKDEVGRRRGNADHTLIGFPFVMVQRVQKMERVPSLYLGNSNELKVELHHQTQAIRPGFRNPGAYIWMSG